VACRSASRGSNFDLLRLGAASAVVLSHAMLVTVGTAWWGANASSPFHQVGDDAVAVFFVISGILVTASWGRDPHLGRYLARRTLRLLPALLATVDVTWLVLGPIVSRLTPGAYFGTPASWAYLLNGTLFLQPYQLPGVFAHQPLTVVNGSLWTLRYEFLCYLVVPLLLAVVAVLRRRAVVLVLLALCAATASAVLVTGKDFVIAGADPLTIAGLPGAAGWSIAPLFVLLSYFIAGMSIQLWLSRIRFDWRLAALAAAVFLVSSQMKVLFPVSVVALAYAVAYFGLRARSVGRPLIRFGDASYGIYVWGFVVAQCVVLAIGPSVSAIAVFVLAMPVTWAIGVLSWRLIEKPALRLKPHAATKPAVAPGPLSGPVASPVADEAAALPLVALSAATGK
jgi:peptidoglycan/LPS O-acetylase OafA/YrhL